MNLVVLTCEEAQAPQRVPVPMGASLTHSPMAFKALKPLIYQSNLRCPGDDVAPPKQLLA